MDSMHNNFDVIAYCMVGVVFGPLSRVALLTPAIPGTNGCGTQEAVLQCD
jgi:hypothetical protein